MTPFSFVAAQGFDEYMNIVLDKAVEVDTKHKTRTDLGTRVEWEADGQGRRTWTLLGVEDRLLRIRRRSCLRRPSAVEGRQRRLREPRDGPMSAQSLPPPSPPGTSTRLWRSESVAPVHE